MNKKQLTLLIVLGVVIGGLGWLAYKKKQEVYKVSTAKMGEKLLPNFPLNDVAQIVIKHGSNELNIVNQGDTWTVKERGGYPANYSTVNEFVRKVWELKIAKPVRVGPSRLPHLELVAPPSGAGSQVDFKDKAGKTLQSLLLGAKHSRDSGGDESPMGGGGSYPNGRYVMLDGDVKTVTLVSEAFANAEPKPEDWVNKDFFKVEKHKSISITHPVPTNSLKLTRESETGEWKLADLKAGESLDTGKSSAVTSALGYPSFNDIVVDAKPEDTGLDKPVTATVETFEGFIYTCKVGKAGANDNYHFQVAVTGDFPKERVAGKDEKPEDKAKLDKEFEEQTSKLKERLKTEQAFGKWTYLVAKWTVEPLLKERKDLLAEPKKDEPKAEEPKANVPKFDPLKFDPLKLDALKLDAPNKEEPK